MKRLIDNPAGLASVSLASLAAMVLSAAGLSWSYQHLSDGAILGAYALLFVPWVVLLWRSSDAQIGWWPLILAALGVRLVFVFAEPLLSDDIFRYVWDGRVARSGVNPFLYAPDAEALAHLRDGALWPKINHPEVPTIYPPAAQMVFRLNAALGGGAALLRALFLLVEALGVAAVWLILEKTGEAVSQAAKRRAFIAYALCPLVFVEVAWSGHLDPIAWMPLVVGLLLFVRSRGVGAAAAAGALVGASISAKFLGILVLPLVLLWRARGAGLDCWKHRFGRKVGFTAACAATVAACYLPYADAGAKLFSGFGTYASRWRANDGPFRAAAAVAEWRLQALAPSEATSRTERTGGELIFRFSEYDEDFRRLGLTRSWQGRQVPATSFSAAQIAETIAKLLAALAVALAMLWAILMRRDPLGGALCVLLMLFFVAPTVHPWYVAWLVPFAALRESKAALTFSFVVLAAYFAWMSARAGGPWQVPAWVVFVEFGVVGMVWLRARENPSDLR